MTQRPRVDVVQQNSTSFGFGAATIANVQEPSSTTRNGDVRAEVKYRSGDFVAVTPNNRQQDGYSGSGSVWYGRLVEDIVYLHQRVPKRLGSTHWIIKSKPQSVNIKVQWLEDVPSDMSPGILMGWHDGSLGEPGSVDDGFPTARVLCRITVEAEVAELDGFERYRMTQDEASRVSFQSVVSPSSSDDSSSSGMEDALQTDVLNRTVRDRLID